MLYHDSRDDHYRAPQGAAFCGGDVVLRLRATGAPLSVTLRTWKDGSEARYPMEPWGQELYAAKITLPEAPGNLWYYFIADYGYEIQYYGNAEDGLGGEGSTQTGEPKSYQITVYNRGAKSPDWMRETVFYQIMPDRFYASKPPNPNDYPANAILHRSTLAPPALILEAGDNAARDFYGGDLKGIEEKLPYLKSLGIGAIYLNPIFSAPSNHKYDTSDYETVDKAFGSNDDFAALCEKAGDMGIRIVLDGVFSHTGSDSRYFNRNGSYPEPGAYQSKSSPYYTWYTFERWPEDYKCWWGFKTLPEADKSSPSFVDYIIGGKDAIAAKWLRLGASGWRLDVADELPMDFIRALRSRAKATAPESAVIGEVWEDPSNKVAYGEARNYFTGDTLDSTMNYPLREALIQFMLREIDAPALVRRMESQRENFPRPFYYAMMNLLSSHDKPRILAILSGRGNMEPAREARHPIQLTQEEFALAKQRFIALWQFITSIPGMPTLYYGDEAGLYGMSDPFCRGAYPWGHEDASLIRKIAEANALRNAHRVLRTGKIKLRAISKDEVICQRFGDAFSLSDEKECAFIRLDRNTPSCDCEIRP